jgi:hypothetical protein
MDPKTPVFHAQLSRLKHANYRLQIWLCAHTIDRADCGQFVHRGGGHYSQQSQRSRSAVPEDIIDLPIPVDHVSPESEEYAEGCAWRCARVSETTNASSNERGFEEE